MLVSSFMLDPVAAKSADSTTAAATPSCVAIASVHAISPCCGSLVKYQSYSSQHSPRAPGADVAELTTDVGAVLPFAANLRVASGSQLLTAATPILTRRMEA